jgi:hypothetical protein
MLSVVILSVEVSIVGLNLKLIHTELLSCLARV